MDKMISKLAEKFLSAFQLTLSVLVFLSTTGIIVNFSKVLWSISSLESLKILFVESENNKFTLF